MQAIVLVGGEGTRLRPLTYSTPKPMLDLVGRPIVARIVEWLSLHGVERAILSLGYRPDVFVSAFPESRWSDVELSYAVESEPLDTAGAIRFAAEYANAMDETVVIINGDVLTDLNLTALVSFHKTHHGEATIALTPVENPSAFGVVLTAEDGRVQSFIEKPAPEDAPTNLINAGTYIFEPEVLKRIATERRVSVEREIFPALVRDNALYAYSSEAYWIDTGSPECYLAAQLDIVRGKRPHVILPENEEVRPGLFIGPDAKLEGDVRPPAFIGRNAWIGQGAIVEDCVIEVDCVVGPGAKVHSSVLLAGSRLASGASCDTSIVGPGARVGANAELRSMCVIGPMSVVEDGASLDSARLPV